MAELKNTITRNTILWSVTHFSLRNKYHTAKFLSLSIQFSKFPTILSETSSRLEKLKIHSLCYVSLTNCTIRNLLSNSGSVYPVRIFVNALRPEKFLEKNSFLFFFFFLVYQIANIYWLVICLRYLT